MFYTVYKTTNQVNGKFYIGTHKTVDLNDNYIGSGKYLQHAIQKYGLENFTKEILYVFDNPKDMFAKEAEIVTEDFLSEENTYNLKVGGFGGFDYINSKGKNLYYDKDGICLNGIKNSKNLLHGNLRKQKLIEKNSWDSYCEKMSLSKKEFFKSNPANFLGKKHSRKTKEKIGLANSFNQKGNKNSQYGSMWITNGTANKKIKKGEAIPNGWKIGRKIILS